MSAGVVVVVVHALGSLPSPLCPAGPSLPVPALSLMAVALFCYSKGSHCPVEGSVKVCLLALLRSGQSFLQPQPVFSQHTWGAI